MHDCVWMRICDADGVEQSSVMVIKDYTFYCHSVADNGPMLIEYEHHPGAGAREARELAGLARRLQEPDGDKYFAAGGTHLLKAVPA